jgi:methionyl aminopeptidase
VIPIKTAPEIQKMRSAGRAARRVLERLVKEVRPGVSTGELDMAAAGFMGEEDCRSAFLGYKGFPRQCCLSINEEVVHGIGGQRKLQFGDVVKIDVGVNKGGWIGDTATTVPVGAVTQETARLLRATEDALGIALSFATNGRRLGDLCSAIEESVVAKGFSVVREFVGHGVGRRLHEEPQVPNFGQKGTGPKLKAGMTIAIEPMVNAGGPEVRVLADGWTVVTRDGKCSAHFEHTVLITDGEPEVLTFS